MEAETDTLVLVHREDRKDIPLLLMVVLWRLGIIKWSTPNDSQESFHPRFVGHSKWRRRVVFGSSMFGFILRGLVAVSAAVCYLFCYFGRADHILRFVSNVICFWPAIFCAPIFCITAVFRNLSRTDDNDIRSITWIKVLNETVFVRQLSYLRSSWTTLLPKLRMFVFFHGTAIVVSSVSIVRYMNIDDKCKTWVSFLWVFLELVGLFYFATFSYFLYLQRVILEEQRKQIVCFISKHKGELGVCITKIQHFFCNYMSFRRLLLPWLCVTLFSSTFGLTVFMMWIYKAEANPANVTQVETPASPIFKGDSWLFGVMCPYSCDDSVFYGISKDVPLYNAVLFAKSVMPAVFTFTVVHGLDLKYLWDNFSIALRLMFNAQDMHFWRDVNEYVEKIHPNVTFDTLVAFLIPVLAIATGVLEGGHHIHFL